MSSKPINERDGWFVSKNRKVIRKMLEWKGTGNLLASRGSYCSHASWSSGDVPSTGCWVIRVLLVVFFFAKITCKSCLFFFFPSKGGIKLPPSSQYVLESLIQRLQVNTCKRMTESNQEPGTLQTWLPQVLGGILAWAHVGKTRGWLTKQTLSYSGSLRSLAFLKY